MPFDGSLPDEVAPGEATALRCKFFNVPMRRRCKLVYDHHGIHEYDLTGVMGPLELKGSASSSPDERCKTCGHKRTNHVRGGCVICAVGFNPTPCHSFVPADAETAGCKHPNRIQITGDKLRRHGRLGFVCHDCGEAWTETAGEPEAPKCVNCDAPPVEGYSYCDSCMTQPEPPRRPPNAVVYALQGGARYEIALPGDATVRAIDGALVITHSSAVMAMTQFKPMEDA